MAEAEVQEIVPASAVPTVASGVQEPNEQPNDHSVSTEDNTTENTTTPLSGDEGPPPLPNEAPPDDGWAPLFDEKAQRWYFYNRFTHATQWENPRVPEATSSSDTVVPGDAGPPGSSSSPVRRGVAGGYNPAIHGDYDPNADYALEAQDSDDEAFKAPPPDPSAIYAAAGTFNRFTGKWQAGHLNPENHNDENKSKRQMHAFFDVDAAANSHDGRSLKAERQNKKLSKTEVKAYNDKKRKKKEVKRRAWLLD